MDGVQAIAESLALQLKRSVAIDDLQMRLLAHTAHDEPVDAYRIKSIMRRNAQPGPTVTEYALRFGISSATGPVRIPASAELESLPRVCVPIRCQNVLLGYLWLMDSEPCPDDAELALAAEAADAAGEVLFRERLLSDLRRGQERELLRDLLHRDKDLREHAARVLVEQEHVPANSRATVLVTAVRPGDGASWVVAVDLALQRAQRRLASYPTLAMTTGTSGGVLVCVGPKTPGREEIVRCATGLIDDIRKEAPEGAAVRVGVGTTADELRLAVRSHDSAAEAVRVAEAIPAMGPVVFWSELGVYRLLAQLPLASLRDDAVPPGLSRLIEQDTSMVLVRTLEVYLETACSPTAAVERLNVHRTSLYYRLGRIEEITEMSLRSGNDRLSLHLGIKMARLLGLMDDVPGDEIGSTPL